MQLCKLTIVKETKKAAAIFSELHICHVVLICSYTISLCTVTNDFKILGAHGGKHIANISCMRQTGNITSQA